jgi:hypothetical protein
MDAQIILNNIYNNFQWIIFTIHYYAVLYFKWGVREFVFSFPKLLGGFPSKQPEDICMVLTNIPTQHWVLNGRDCEEKINSYVEENARALMVAILFPAGLLLLASTAYKIFNMPTNFIVWISKRSEKQQPSGTVINVVPPTPIRPSRSTADSTRKRNETILKNKKNEKLADICRSIFSSYKNNRFNEQIIATFINQYDIIIGESVGDIPAIDNGDDGDE